MLGRSERTENWLLLAIISGTWAKPSNCSAGDRAGVASAQGNLGNYYNYLGQFDKTTSSTNPQKTSDYIVVELGGRAGEGRAHDNLGNNYTSPTVRQNH